MNIIQFIYRLIERHVPITKAEVKGLESEATAWYENEATASKIGAAVKKYSETWWARTILAVLFIPAQAWIRGIMNPVDDDIEEEDDD